jgi:hypothetical protein
MAASGGVRMPCRLLATEDTEVLFVAGCEENQVRFHSQFDRIILLSAPL